LPLLFFPLLPRHKSTLSPLIAFHVKISHSPPITYEGSTEGQPRLSLDNDSATLIIKTERHLKLFVSLRLSSFICATITKKACSSVYLFISIHPMTFPSIPPQHPNLYTHFTMNDISHLPLPGNPTSEATESPIIDLREDMAYEMVTSDLAKSLKDYEVRILPDSLVRY
jgi:hypothetical protein